MFIVLLRHLCEITAGLLLRADECDDGLAVIWRTELGQRLRVVVVFLLLTHLASSASCCCSSVGEETLL